MAQTVRQRAQPHGHQGLYLFVAGVLLIVTGLAVAMTAVSFAPGNAAPPSVAAAAGLLLAIAIMAAGIATVLHRGDWLAETAALSLVLLNVGYAVASGRPEQAVGGILSALAILILVRAGRSLFGPVLPIGHWRRPGAEP